MEKPTVERCIETKFFKRHYRHMPAVINVKKPKDKLGEMAEDITSKPE